ncbi:MAG: hypothetical protein EOP04_27320, partial [Proteobacteria bacterium]
MKIYNIAGGYSIKEIDAIEMRRILDLHFNKCFANRANAEIKKPSDASIEKIKERGAKLHRWELRLGVYHEDKIVGWHFGYATDAETYYMQNSAVLTEFGNKGVYSRLLKIILSHVADEGFQVVTSLHHANNAAVIIPKLKTGFIISGTQFHERFRHLIEMKYFVD